MTNKRNKQIEKKEGEKNWRKRMKTRSVHSLADQIEFIAFDQGKLGEPNERAMNGMDEKENINVLESKLNQSTKIITTK